MPPRHKPGKWVVYLNYRNRSILYAVLFVTLGAHLHERGYGLLAWSLLALYFLGAPHLQYWLARRSPDGGAAELHNMTADAVGFGLWAGALQFPLWIAFILLCGVVVNLTVFRGPRGTLLALAVYAAAAVAGWALPGGFGLAPQMGWPAVALSMTCLVLFLAVVASGAYHRALKLHETRERLRASEQMQQSANDALQLKLDEIRSLQHQLSEQANRDPLTGLYNRRYLDATMDRELARCRREGQPLSMMLIDIDHFKRINDTWGHQAGDEVLRHLAAMLNVRAGDVASRYGGEEFLVLLPGMPQSVAIERAEQYRKTFETGVVRFGEFRIHATLSIGIACYPEDARSADELVRTADQALYRAKAGGRNQVEVSEPPIRVAQA